MQSYDLFTQNIAEVRVIYSHKVRPADMKKINSSRDAYDLLLNSYQDCLNHHERFIVLLMSRANKVLGVYKVSDGGLCGTIVDVRMVMQAAIKSNAVSIIISHNHPSGSVQPSAADNSLTKQISEACKILDISLLDHIIVSEDAYFSYGDEGMI